MLVWAYLQWWYGGGWRETGARIWRRNARIYLDFSVPILLGTLFAPWRRIVGGSGGSLPEQLRAMIDSLLSRVIGLIVRVLALIVAGFLMLANLLLGLVMFIIWPVLPPLAFGLLLWGFVS